MQYVFKQHYKGKRKYYVKSTKNHTCLECRSVIKKGRKYCNKNCMLLYHDYLRLSKNKNLKTLKKAKKELLWLKEQQIKKNKLIDREVRSFIITNNRIILI